MADAKEYVSQLAKDMQVLESSSTSLGRTFAELGGTSNKLWTIAARLSSGSGFWKLQARVRSLSNMFELYYKSQDKALMKMLEGIDASEKLASAFSRTEEKYNLFTKNTSKITKAQKDDSVFKVFNTRLQDEEKAFYFTQKTYSNAYKKFQKQMKKDNKALKKELTLPMAEKSWKDILSNNFGSKMLGKVGKATMATAGFGWKQLGLKKYKAGQTMPGVRGEGTQRAGEGGERVGLFKMLKIHADRAKKGGKYNKYVRKQLKKVMPALNKGLKMIYGVIGKAIMGFMVYIPLIILVFMALKMAFNPVKKWATKNQKLFTDIKDQIIDLFYILKSFFKAIWDGDIVKVLKIWFFEIIPAVAKLLFSVGKVIAKALYVIVKEILKALYSLAKAIVNGVTNWFGNKTGLYASGGIVNTPLQIVGERGPELVSMPRGSRVYSNAESQRMSGGNTIHVHVNGRVGASDSEIRDIANKVAREINLRMNRTGTTGTGF